MRRIFYLYIITHIAPFPTLRLHLVLLLSLSPSPAPVLLLFPRFSFFLRSSSSRSPPISPSLPLPPVTSCIYFILLLNKPLPVILAPTCVFTRTWDPRQTQSPLDARISLRDHSRHEKYFFPTLPFVLGITVPSRAPSVIWERVYRDSRRDSILKGSCAWSAIKNPRERERDKSKLLMNIISGDAYAMLCKNLLNIKRL